MGFLPVHGDCCHLADAVWCKTEHQSWCEAESFARRNRLASGCHQFLLQVWVIYPGCKHITEAAWDLWKIWWIPTVVDHASKTEIAFYLSIDLSKLCCEGGLLPLPLCRKRYLPNCESLVSWLHVVHQYNIKTEIVSVIVKDIRGNWTWHWVGMNCIFGFLQQTTS